MNRLTTVGILAILLVGLVLPGLSDTDISVADASIPDNEVTSSVSKASNFLQLLPSQLRCILRLMDKLVITKVENIVHF